MSGIVGFLDEWKGTLVRFGLLFAFMSLCGLRFQRLFVTIL